MPAYDLEYARDAGLIDMFYYDPKSGEDGLLHTLSGNLDIEDGSLMPQGYHHEPSGEALAPLVQTPNGQAVRETRVDRDHIPGQKAKRRKMYAEYPMEPYAAQVIIGGYRKLAINRNEDGTKTITPARNSMFPKEYDALGVMQAVRIASENIDPEQTKYGTASNGQPVKIVQGEVPLIDGSTPMRVRLVLDAQTDKVLTALPMMSHNPGLMKLTPEQLMTHMLSSTKVR